MASRLGAKRQAKAHDRAAKKDGKRWSFGRKGKKAKPAAADAMDLAFVADDEHVSDPGDGAGATGRKKHKKKRGKPSPPLIGAMVLVLALAGTATWLAIEAPETKRRLESVRSLGRGVPVMLPDGTPRFADAAQAAPEEEVPLDPVDMPVTLTPSRNDQLLERLRVGRVPRVAPDGTAPWQYYARPFPQEDKRPRIAIVLTGLGLSEAATHEAIDRLPGAVTFSFTPTAENLQAKVDEARAKGHEVLLSVPMQPVGYPANDPGPNTLLSNLSDEENVRRLEATLAAFTGYVGVTSKTDSGTEFLTQRESLRGVLLQVQRRGLVFLDLWQVSGSKAAAVSKELSLPRAISDLQIDRIPSGIGIDAQLAQLERLAQANGVAVGFAEVSNPVSLERLSVWSARLRDRGIVLAPVTAIVNRQPDR
ncbi:divergent polysaccharide deacetylase family protein [Niveispirillum sp.]|uniref:divergent polysaccharide deacetylase family protein n=1 Tax=Niveispirillum sp. TaxID=1917217 RepID=UPI001B564CCF|nr:divergent polysaccharide deacetylase family protein [Niveispirillum sp.]MBP7336050.1 divergent polysaccharide deacetylase family protein [Niveispirillum sp.]